MESDAELNESKLPRRLRRFARRGESVPEQELKALEARAQPPSPLNLSAQDLQHPADPSARGTTGPPAPRLEDRVRERQIRFELDRLKRLSQAPPQKAQQRPAPAAPTRAEQRAMEREARLKNEKNLSPAPKTSQALVPALEQKKALAGGKKNDFKDVLQEIKRSSGPALEPKTRLAEPSSPKPLLAPSCPRCHAQSPTVVYCPDCGLEFCDKCGRAEKSAGQMTFFCPQCGKSFKALVS